MRYLVCIILAGCAQPPPPVVHAHFGGWTADMADKVADKSVPVDERQVDAAQ